MGETASWLRRRLGWIVSLVIVFIPVAIWIFGRDLTTDLATNRGGLIFMAKLCAFSGFAMYAWSLILSTRLRIFERLFLGLDKMLRCHYILGGVSILLIVLHPVFLSLARATSSWERALKLWLPSASWMLNWGLLALYLMLIVTFITYRVNLKHQTFIRLHSWFGVLIIPAMIHAFMASGHMADNTWLRRYMIVLTFLAVIAFFYHSVLGGLFIKRYKYTVKSVNKLSQDMIEIVVSPKHWPLVFTPGQFAFVSFHDPHIDSEPHPYSFSSSYRDGSISFTIKNLGDHTAQIFHLKPGATAYLEGPYGAFSYLNSKKHRQVWVAGGIGITPFLAMARSLNKKKRRGSHSIDFFYCTKTKIEAIFIDELYKIAKDKTFLKIHHICETTDGFLTSETIAKAAKGLDDKEYYICGPPPMMHSLRKQLLEASVPEDNIHLEEFAFK